MTEKGPLAPAKGTTWAPPTPRFMDVDSKRRILSEWEAIKLEIPPDGDLAGRGWPDPEMIPTCDALNQLDGVCTLQSCSGHGKPGRIWLWFDEEKNEKFVRWSHVLARMSGIELVTTKHTDWGQQIAAIEFDGRLDRALKSVLIFFRTLTH